MIFKQDIPMTVFFQEENGLLEKHWKELANHPDKILLKPDTDRYQKLQDVGMLSNIIAYEDEMMVGYAIIFLVPHMHYSDDIFAMVDVIFMDPEARNSRGGLVLINHVERICKEKKASVLTYHTKPAHATIEKILYRKGFSHYENILGKLLKE